MARTVVGLEKLGQVIKDSDVSLAELEVPFRMCAAPAGSVNACQDKHMRLAVKIALGCSLAARRWLTGLWSDAHVDWRTGLMVCDGGDTLAGSPTRKRKTSSGSARAACSRLPASRRTPARRQPRRPSGLFSRVRAPTQLGVCAAHSAVL